MKKIVAVTVALLFLTACPVEDAGFHVANGTELYPGVLPALVVGDETCPAGLVADTVAWWNASLGVVALEEGEPADVTVTVGMIPSSTGDPDESGEPLGVTRFEYAEDGQVLRGEVTISSDIAYDEETVWAVARHELGHVPFALADDPGPPRTVDLRSVMADPLDVLGELTDHDLALLEPFLP